MRNSLLVALIFTAACPQIAFAASPCPHTWKRSLSVGSVGPDVVALQQLLNDSPTTQVATAGSGSPGMESPYFGPKTANAVRRFQEAHAAEILTPIGMQAGSGRVGTRTLQKLNELCSLARTSGETTSPSAQTPVLHVARGDQPAATIAPAGAGGVPFTTFTLSASGVDATVHRITISRVGAAHDDAFESIVVLDESGEEVTEEKHLNAQHEAILAADITIPAGTTRVFTVYGNMEGDLQAYDGQMPVLRVSDIQASLPITQGLPIDGTAQTVNATLEIGSASASLSSFDPGVDRTVYINETDVRLAGIRLSASGTEDLELSGIEWEQAGSAGSHDIEHVATIVNNVAYTAEQDGRAYVSTFEPALRIPRGHSIDLYLRGTILPSAANRTIKFDISESGMVALTGLHYGYGVGVAAGSHTATSGNAVFLTSDGTAEGEELTPFFSGALFTVSSGSVSSVSGN